MWSEQIGNVGGLRLEAPRQEQHTHAVEDKEAEIAREGLEDAAKRLDATISGYDEEGYTLCCPALARARGRLPHSHWWAFLSGGQRHGDGGLCS